MLNVLCVRWEGATHVWVLIGLGWGFEPLYLPKKEVIQPHLPVRLPCYDFTLVTSPAFGIPLPRVGVTTWGMANSHSVTGGVCKARERIHHRMADRWLLAIPPSCRRVAAYNPNWGRVYEVTLALAGSHLFVPAIVARVSPRARGACWLDLIPTFLRLNTGGLSRVPNCGQLETGVALVAGLNPTSYDTSWRQPCTTCVRAPEGTPPSQGGSRHVKPW